MKTLFHGGVPGLRVGQEILPPSVTQNKLSAFHFIEKAVRDGSISRKDALVRGGQPGRVYLTEDPQAALFFAAAYPGGGTVYRVVASRDDLVADPDGLLGRDWHAPKATVLGIEVKKLSKSRALRLLRQFLGTLSDG